jgi:hypothetical protein
MASDEAESGFLGLHFQKRAQRLSARCPEYFDNFNIVNRIAHDLFQKDALFRHVGLRREAGFSPELFAVCLYIRLLEDCQAAVLLASRGFEQSVSALVRIALEALLKLVVAYKDRAFFRKVLDADVLDQIKLLGVACLAVETTPEQRERFEKKRKELRQQTCMGDIKPISTIRIAEKAGMLGLYHTVFRLSSSSVHLSPLRLMEFIEMRDGKPASIIVDVHDRLMRTHVLTATEFALIATEQVAQFFRAELSREIAGVKRWLETVPRDWPDDPLADS